MKKFTLISLLMLICCTMAKAELMDKFFFKIPTDKADGWTLQDAGRMTLTPSKDYLEVKLTQRRLNLSSTNVRQELLLRFSERVPNPRFIKPYPSYRVRPPPYVAIHIKPRLSS